MNYQKIYDDICKRGQDRILSKETYTEKHHIVPKCIGGIDDCENITRLTAREHFICHWILAEKLYPNHHGLWFAFWRMCGPSNPNQSRYLPSSKIYEEVKNKISMIKSEKNTGSGNPMFGRKFTDEHREKLRRSRSKRVGLKAPNFGKKFSEEWINSLSIARTGPKNGFFGKSHSDETKKILSEKAKLRTSHHKLPLIDENGIIYESRKDFMDKTKISESKMYALFKENKLKNYVKD